MHIHPSISSAFPIRHSAAIQTDINETHWDSFTNRTLVEANNIAQNTEDFLLGSFFPLPVRPDNAVEIREKVSSVARITGATTV